MHRRRLLATSASALAAAFAGCTGDGGSDATTTDATSATTTQQATTTTTTTSTTTAATTAEPTTATETTSGGGGGGDAAAVVTVAPDGDYRFDPETVTVAAGEAVRWEWANSGHNVRPDTQPADADWTGTPGGGGELYDAGYSYEYTFEIPGRYDYVCAPHQSFGMVGSVVVE
jgi:plastocyanin